jgi:hypothetical protein
MRNCMELTITLSSKQDGAGERKTEENRGLTASTLKREVNFKNEKAIDYSDDIVIRKLRRMLP